MIAFNLYLELLAISAVIRFLEVSRSARRRLPRRQYSTYLAFMVPRIGSTLVTLFWALPIFVALVAVWHDGFDLGFTWSFLSTTVLFFAGVWLVTTHLWALSVRGILNHLAALTGVVAGAALVALVAQPYLIFLQR